MYELLIIVFLIIIIICLINVLMQNNIISGGAEYNVHDDKIILSQKFPNDNKDFIKYCQNLPFNVSNDDVIEINSRFDFNVTIDQLKSFKNTQMTLHYLNGIRDNKLIDKYKNVEGYEERFKIVQEIMEKYKCNPLNIISKLNYDVSMKNDKRLGIFTLDSQRKSREDAVNFEIKIQKLITKMNQKFVTEDDLKGQNLTPDILLKDSDIYYKDGEELVKIYWIDAKNYPYYENNLTGAKITKKATAYTEKFGKGLYVFNGIWSKNHIKDAYIIDYKNLV